MVIRLSDFGTRLQGKSAGKKHYAQICGMLTETKSGEFVFLDFNKVESVNGSWINMAISPLFRWAAECQNDLFPILCRFPVNDLDELELVAEVNQQCYPVSSDSADPIPALEVIGPLDEGLRTTLNSPG
jgi:hypothetical protein